MKGKTMPAESKETLSSSVIGIATLLPSAEIQRRFGDSKASERTNLPPMLYLAIIAHKEWGVYQHAWGEAVVSTRQDLGDRYAVDHLRFVLDGVGKHDEKSQNNVASLSCDVANVFLGWFAAGWYAEAYDRHYGRWHTGFTF
jgi:hypothetical protein